MAPRLRVILPLGAGVITAALTIWDIHNSRVIDSVGMGWDTGAPIWPYQTSDILLRLVGFPAYFVVTPLANALGFVAPLYHLLVFPTVLAWWWFLGLAFDRPSILSTVRRTGSLRVTLIGLAVLLLCSAAAVSANTFRWWFQYGTSLWSVQALLLLRFLTPAIWCCFLSFILAVAAKKPVSR